MACCWRFPVRQPSSNALRNLGCEAISLKTRRGHDSQTCGISVSAAIDGHLESFKNVEVWMDLCSHMMPHSCRCRPQVLKAESPEERSSTVVASIASKSPRKALTQANVRTIVLFSVDLIRELCSRACPICLCEARERDVPQIW